MYQGRVKGGMDLFAALMWLYWEGVSGCLIDSNVYESFQGWIIPSDSTTGYSKYFDTPNVQLCLFIGTFWSYPFWIL